MRTLGLIAQMNRLQVDAKSVNVFTFEQLSQMSGWGAPRPGSIDVTQLYGLQFQVEGSGNTFDIWIDDISFYGCGQ